jgi:hypothetical protein
MTLIRRLLDAFIMALIVAAMSLGLHYLGTFNVAASILLGGGFALVAVWLQELWKLAAFRPY